MSEQNEQKDLEVLWKPQQVAAYLGLNKVTVYRWLQESRVIDPTKIIRIGKSVRIPRSEVVRIAGITRAKLQGDVELKP